MEDIIKFMRDELKIKISKVKEQKIIEKVKEQRIIEKIKTRDYDDNVYWYIDIDERTITFFFDGLITKKEYEKIKLLDKKTALNFGEIAKHTYAKAYLSELCFIENEDEMVKHIKGNKRNDFDLMQILYDSNILECD